MSLISLHYILVFVLSAHSSTQAASSALGSGSVTCWVACQVICGRRERRAHGLTSTPTATPRCGYPAASIYGNSNSHCVLPEPNVASNSYPYYKHGTKALLARCRNHNIASMPSWQSSRHFCLRRNSSCLSNNAMRFFAKECTSCFKSSRHSEKQVNRNQDSRLSSNGHLSQCSKVNQSEDSLFARMLRQEQARVLA